MLAKPNLVEIAEAKVVALVGGEAENICFAPVAVVLQAARGLVSPSVSVCYRVGMATVAQVFGIEVGVGIERLIEGMGLI